MLWFYWCALFWWSSMEHVKFLEYKCFTSCNEDGCLSFELSYENPLLYDCCTCHRRFYHAIYDIPLDIGACIIKYNGGLMIANYFIIMGPMPVIAVHVDALDHYISLHHQYHHHVLIKLHKIQLSTLLPHRNVKLCWLLMMMNIWKKICNLIKWCCIQYQYYSTSFCQG